MNLEEYSRRNAALNALSRLAMKGRLDAVDVLILRTLQESGSSPAGIAEGLALSAPQVSRRLRKLISFELVSEILDPADLRGYSLIPAPKSDNVMHEIRRKLGKDAEIALDFQRALIGMRRSLGRFCKTKAPGYAAVRVLAAVSLSETAPSVGNLSDICGLPQSSISCAVSSLERLGLVVRRRTPAAENAGRDARNIVVEPCENVHEIKALIDFTYIRDV